MRFTENHPIINEELASQHEKENNAGNDLGSAFAQVKFGGDLNGSFFQENQQEGNKCHCKGIKFREPGNNDSGKSPSAGGTGGNGMAGTADQQKSRDPADRRGNGEAVRKEARVAYQTV